MNKPCATETGLLDFHKIIVTVMKLYFYKEELKKSNIEIIVIFVKKNTANIF